MGWLPDEPGSGLDRVFYALARHLPDAGVHVNGVVMGEGSGERGSFRRIERAAPTSAPLPRRLKGIRTATRALVDAHPPDLVAAHFALYATPVLDTLNCYPFVMHFHGPWAYESEAEVEAKWKVALKVVVECTVYRRAARFIVLSSAFRRLLVERYGVAADRVRIVPGGVDVDRFDTGLTRQTARERLGWPTDRPILLAVRRLVRRVGLDRLIDAIDRVRQRHPDVLLHIAGKGPLREALARQIQERGLADHAQLLGFVPDDDLPLAYRAANLSVVPTIAHEGFGLIVVESLAAGTPPLVTPVGGLPEVVRDLSPALIMHDASSDAIAEHLTAALRGDLSLPSPEDCRAFAARNYDWPVIARQTRSVYEEVV
jgi:glycosyltransferase involved in cell wall biosynthesis